MIKKIKIINFDDATKKKKKTQSKMALYSRSL